MIPRILLVEDDNSIRQTVYEELSSRGWEVEVAMDGQLGLELALEKHYDCLILDIMLPRIHGYEICKCLRREGKGVPILMMSALGQEVEVLRGFEVGATDYVRKPFSLAELVMRIKVHLGGVDEQLVDFSGYQLDLNTSTLTRPDGSKVQLTQKEKGLLNSLVQKKGQALSRKTLLSQVWGNHWTMGERSVDRCVKTLRKKIASNVQDCPIKTIRHLGYAWSDC